MKSLLINCGSVFLLAGMCLFSSQLALAEGEDMTEAEGESTESGIPIADLADVSPLFAAIQGGVLDYANGSAVARFNLGWEYLPLDEQLQMSSLRNNSVPIEIEIPNSAFQGSEWINYIEKEAENGAEFRDALIKMYRLGDSASLQEIEKGNSDLLCFSTFWLVDTQSACPSSSDNAASIIDAVSSQDYFGLVRDATALRFLLRSEGINFLVRTNGSDGQSLDSELEKIEDITWRIRLYPFIIRGDDPESEEDVTYYRVAVDAVTDDPVRRNVFEVSSSENENESTDEITVQVSVSFNESNNTAGLFNPILGTNDLMVSLEQAVPEPLRKEFDSDSNGEDPAVSSLNRVFSIVGGQTLGSIVTGFLGGSQNGTVLSGGLIAGDRVRPVVGANYEFSPRARVSAGMALGISPGGENESLFLGPSVRTSIFTLSAGAAVADEDDALNVDPAGVISFDLSQLLGERDVVRNITVDNSEMGGDWGIASNILSENVSVAEISVDACGDSELLAAQRDGSLRSDVILLRQFASRDETPIPEDMPRAQISLPLQKLLGETDSRRFVPAGLYSIPEEQWIFTLNSNDDTESNDISYRLYNFCPGGVSAAIDSRNNYRLNQPTTATSATPIDIAFARCNGTTVKCEEDDSDE
ncbi:MAG: hypothetical protein AB4050_13080 [Synechococcus sp.]